MFLGHLDPVAVVRVVGEEKGSRLLLLHTLKKSRKSLGVYLSPLQAPQARLVNLGLLRLGELLINFAQKIIIYSSTQGNHCNTNDIGY
jgi:hypothetical protein